MRVADVVRAPRAHARLGRRLGEADQLDAHAVALHVWKPRARSDGGSSRSHRSAGSITCPSASIVATRPSDMPACLRPPRTRRQASGPAEAAPARPPPLLPLARALAHQRLQLRDRLLDLRLPPAPRCDQAIGVLELAERLLQLAAQPRGERQVVEALGLAALPPEGEAGQALRLFGIGIEAERTLELGERRAALVQVRERIAALGVHEGVVGMLAEVALERLARLGRLLERHVHAPERTIGPTTEAAELTTLLERPARRLELADGLVHASHEKLPLGVVRLLLRASAVARDHHLGRVRDRLRHRLSLGQLAGGRGPAGRGLQLLRADRGLDVRDPVLGQRVGQHVGGHAGRVDALLGEQALEERAHRARVVAGGAHGAEPQEVGLLLELLRAERLHQPGADLPDVLGDDRVLDQRQLGARGEEEVPAELALAALAGRAHRASERQGDGEDRRQGGAPAPHRRPSPRATSWAKYVMMTSAPARRMATRLSSTTRASSIQPRSAAAFTIAYSPLTW